MKDEVILARLDDYQEANIIIGLLEANGIPARIQGYNPDAVRPEFYQHSFFVEQTARILVAPRDKLRARKLVEQMRDDASRMLDEEFDLDEEDEIPVRRRVNWTRYHAYLMLGSLIGLVVWGYIAGRG